MGSRLKKGQWSESTKNRVIYSKEGLWVFMAMLKLNTNAKGNHKGTKKKISKISLCRYMAEHNKLFRTVWLKNHPNKSYPKDTEGREAIGEAFYRSNVADMRRYVRRDDVEKEMRKMFKRPTEFKYFDKGKFKYFKY